MWNFVKVTCQTSHYRRVSWYLFHAGKNVLQTVFGTYVNTRNGCGSKIHSQLSNWWIHFFLASDRTVRGWKITHHQMFSCMNIFFFLKITETFRRSLKIKSLHNIHEIEMWLNTQFKYIDGILKYALDELLKLFSSIF